LYVKVSADETALVPPGVVTITFTTPAFPGGDVTVREVALAITTLVAGVEPKETVAPGTNPVPATVTVLPPATNPDAGITPVTVGNASYVNLSAADVALVPPAVVTVTLSCPAAPGGDVAVIELGLSTVTFVPGADPNCTVAPPLNPVPDIVIAVPPPTGPACGLMAVTVGADW
jgi:hypothetical protein